VAIAEYVRSEVRKVDGIRAYLKHWQMLSAAAKAESEIQGARHRALENRINRLKEISRAAMEEIGVKRLEGTTGVLRVQKNGGKVPVVVTDPLLVPDEYVVYEGRIRGVAWAAVRDFGPNGWIQREDVQMERKVLANAIQADLEKGIPVPGAYLGERGEHLRCE
jgi:hypothetical protein